MPTPSRVHEGTGAPSWLLPLLLVLFFLSGFCALIYQTLWLRLLSLIFGVTVYAASTVLASFMSGLAIGSLMAGLVAERTRRPLRLFGIAELLVGITALLTPWALDAVTGLYIDWYPSLAGNLGQLTLVRFLLSFSVLLVPTVLMGATLPLVLKSALGGSRDVGQKIGLLYGINTTGAIVGALLAGFVLIPGIGVQAAFRLAAVINALIGMAAIVASGQADRVASTGTPTANSDGRLGEPALPTVSAWTRRTVLLVFGISGAVSLALEVLWFRVLVIFLRPTTYSFTLMLGTVLAGIALGSYLASPILKRGRHLLVWLAGLELGIAVLALSSFQGLSLTVYSMQWLRSTLADSPVLAYLSPLLVASLLAILPTALLFGMAFPIGLRVWAGAATDDGRAAKLAGVFYSVNVCGAIAGAAGAGFVLIPSLGSTGTLLALASVTLLGALLLVVPVWKTSRRLAVTMTAIALAAFGTLATFEVDPFEVALTHFHRNERRIWREEGVQTSVAIHERRTGARIQDRMRVMYLDGMHQSNDMRSTVFGHSRIGFLPTALHPHPTRALVVGLGAGTTPGAIAAFPGVQVDVVELSETVVRAAHYFRIPNQGVLTRPNVHLRVDDGRNFLLLSPPKQYDIITADVILPRHAGAANVYSVQYFELVKRALKDDGIVLQWNGGDTATEYALILRTFRQVFPDMTLWGDGSLMIGTKRPLTVDLDAYRRKLADPAVAKVLASYNLDAEDKLLRQFVAAPADVRALVGEGPVTTDDHPLVEYFLSRPQGEAPMDLSNTYGDVRPFVRSSLPVTFQPPGLPAPAATPPASSLLR
ncbi:fused MFS/spermidine synthase [Luteitalea sp.]|uniref:fused MFS/spermidine synthase n=1 Tax=Luteitalea sp. TaxID=2004800 RepID=UPI0025BC9746|nr:fused MFS/spermidine synthase [Luteitalea sp.]